MRCIISMLTYTAIATARETSPRSVRISLALFWRYCSCKYTVLYFYAFTLSIYFNAWSLNKTTGTFVKLTYLFHWFWSNIVGSVQISLPENGVDPMKKSIYFLKYCLALICIFYFHYNVQASAFLCRLYFQIYN